MGTQTAAMPAIRFKTSGEVDENVRFEAIFFAMAKDHTINLKKKQPFGIMKQKKLVFLSSNLSF